MPIQRQSLRTQIKEEILRRLDDGDLEHGANISEPRLAADLGVSRTPLREALIALESEGFTESHAGRGFRWARVSERELRDSVPIIAALESLALELTPLERWATIAPALLEQADAFPAPAERHGVIIRYDDEWHDLMLSGCLNERLLEIHATQRVLLRRYERLLVPDEQSLQRAASEHREIARCLLEADIPGAQRGLRANWMNGLERLVVASRERGIAR